MSMRWPPLLLVLASACSTVAPLPSTNECDSDLDCEKEGDVCAPDTRVCVPGSALPPRRDIAFEIQEADGFRVEIAGCDCDVTPNTANNEIAIVHRELQQTFQLDVFDDGDADSTPLASTFILSATNRFTATSPAAGITYPMNDGAEMDPQLVPTNVLWPRYHPYDALPPALADGGIVVWRTIPETGAPVYRMLRPPQTNPKRACTSDDECCDPMTSCANFCMPGVGECTVLSDPHFAYAYAYDRRCDRELTSRVVRVDPMTLERVDDHAIDPTNPDEKTPGLSGAAISVRYADVENGDRLGEFALSATLPQNREPECSSDAGCVSPEQFCEDNYSQCVLALAGRTADNGVVTTNNTGDFSAGVYSYCEHEAVNLALTRAFTLTVTPGAATPSVDYSFEVPFSPFMGDTPGPTPIGHDLCIPDWGPPVGVTLDLSAKSITVIGSGDDAYRCCDVSCLPASPEDAATVEEVPDATSCDGRTSSGPRPSAIVDTALNDALDPEDWLAADCLPPLRDEDGAIGGIRTAPIDCNAMDGTCFLPELAAGRDGSVRDYNVRVEMPVGSFFRSFVQPLPVDGTEATARQAFELDRRVFVRGRVLLGRDAESCAAASVTGDCGSEGAVVLAERLRMPDDPSPALAPYFHPISTYFDPVAGELGHFILPLDPGVYLVTALPNSGSAGGPADIEILDLRDGSDREHDFVLETGVIVTLDISDGFDPSTQVVPLDVRSWVNLDHPGRLDDPDPAKTKVDLNAPGECMATSGDGRCRIRRLVASESITGSQVGRVRFTAREGSGSCPGCAAPQ